MTPKMKAFISLSSTSSTTHGLLLSLSNGLVEVVNPTTPASFFVTNVLVFEKYP